MIGIGEILKGLCILLGISEEDSEVRRAINKMEILLSSRSETFGDFHETALRTFVTRFVPADRCEECSVVMFPRGFVRCPVCENNSKIPTTISLREALCVVRQDIVDVLKGDPLELHTILDGIVQILQAFDVKQGGL